MNRPIVRLYGLVVLLFALLVAFTSRWTIFDAAALRSNPLNKRGLLEQERIARGRILAADGTVLARSTRGAEGTYEREYPKGEEFAHAIGYSYTDLSQSGLERFRNSVLNGQSGTNLQTILDQLQGKRPQGDEVLTTLDPKAQQAAIAALGEHRGAVLALDPRDGAVKVMVSTPSFDPNKLLARGAYAKLTKDTQGRPLVNRAVQFGYAPGSTFKVVTATAAIDTGQFTAQSTLSGRNDVLVSGVPLGNDNGESLGQITLTEALAKSVNTVWAQVAEKLGKQTMARYMTRFGFDRKPELDYPAEEMSASGEYQAEKILSPTSSHVDVGRLGIGQDKLAVVPLQMAEVAAAVADHGTVDDAAPDRTDRRCRWAHSAADLPTHAVDRDEAGDRVRGGEHDGGCCQRRHRDPGADPRGAGGGQDRHRRDAVRHRDQQCLVYCVCSRCQPTGGDCGDPRTSPRPGCLVCGACRQRGNGSVAP